MWTNTWRLRQSASKTTTIIQSGEASLKNKGVASIWPPASQDSSHVGNAGIGVVGLRGAPLSLPTFATVQFKRFFDGGGWLGARCRWGLVG